MLSSFFYLESNKTRVRYVSSTPNEAIIILLYGGNYHLRRVFSCVGCSILAWIICTVLQESLSPCCIVSCLERRRNPSSQQQQKVDLNDVCVFVFCLRRFFFLSLSVASLIASFSSEEDEPTHPSSSWEILLLRIILPMNGSIKPYCKWPKSVLIRYGFTNHVRKKPTIWIILTTPIVHHHHRNTNTSNNTNHRIDVAVVVAVAAAVVVMILPVIKNSVTWKNVFEKSKEFDPPS